MSSSYSGGEYSVNVHSQRELFVATLTWVKLQSKANNFINFLAGMASIAHDLH